MSFYRWLPLIACAALGCHSADAVAPPLFPDLALAADGAAASDLAMPRDAGSRDAAPIDLAKMPDAARAPVTDGGAACVSQFGAGMSAAFGRIDGTLLAVVTPSDNGCPNDDNHVILQVQMSGSVYELWVNIGTDADPMSTDSLSAVLGAPAFAEGWHTDATLDYVQTFGLASTAFSTTPPLGVIQELTSMLPLGQPISVYATGYGPDGGHDVHRQMTGQDGAVVISPATAPRYLLFRFSDQIF